MATLFDDASLVMIPSGYKDDKLYSIKPTSGDGDFTFSRDGSGASPATRVNSAGLIEKGRTNELTYSNTFSNAAWSKSSSITFTSGQSGYDGTNDGWTATPPNTTGNSAFYQNNISNLATSSIYAKYNGYHLRIRVGGTGGNRAFATFDLQNGSIGNSGGSAFVDANIQSIGNGWYRCSLTKNYSTAGFAEFQISENATDGDNPSWTPNGTDGVYVQDAQLEKGLVATSYIETTTAAASAGILGDMPRLDYSGGASCPSLLLEPSRTNNITQSEYVDSWGIKTNISVVSNDGTSPEGVINASNIYPTTTGACFFYEGSITYTSGTTYTYSVFAKANGKDYLQITTSGASFSNQYCTFDLALGATDNNGFESVGIEDYGNGWYRCYVVETAISTASSRFVIGLVSNANAGRLSSVTADGTNGVLVYGVVSEAGSYPTSYIPTYGTSASRAADNCVKTGISDLIGQTEGTLFAEIDFQQTESSSRFIAVGDGTTANRIAIFTNSSNDGLRVFVADNSNIQVDSSIAVSKGVVKLALAYDNNDYVLYVNGVSRITDTSASVPACSNVYLGRQEISLTNFLGSGIKQALVFKTRLTNAELAALTTL